MTKNGKGPRPTLHMAVADINGQPLRVEVISKPHTLDGERVIDIRLPRTRAEMETPVDGLVFVPIEERDIWDE